MNNCAEESTEIEVIERRYISQTALLYFKNIAVRGAMDIIKSYREE